MDYFVFKLNIQPDILLTYKDKGELNYLLENQIPLAFENVLQVKKIDDLFELISEKNDEEKFNSQFIKLEEKTIKLFELYNQVLENYEATHEIHYSKEFLDLNQKCMNIRRRLEKKFPGIIKSYDFITDEEIDKKTKLRFNSKVGTGITHLRKFYKIKHYLDKDTEGNSINPLNLKAIYNPYTEHLLIEAESETASLNYIIALVELVNGNISATKHIGKININPIYESISLPDEYSEVSYVIVYPNGNPPLERHNILIESEAKEISTTIIGTDGKPLKKGPIESHVKKEGEKGYLKSFKAKGGRFLQKIKKLSYIDKTS